MHVVDEFIAFVDGIEPGVSATWKGARPEEIAEIEDLVDGELPAFYRWFLETMAGDLGRFGHPAFDFRAATVIDLHARLDLPDDERLLFIGCNPDPVMPTLNFLDLEHPARDDARVVNRVVDSETLHVSAETLREMLAFGFMLRAGVRPMPQRCWGGFSTDALTEELGEALEALGWASLLTTGPYCGLYRRRDVKLALSSTIGDDTPEVTYFRIGADDEITIRSAIGEVAQRTAAEVEIFEWDPSLP